MGNFMGAAQREHAGAICSQDLGLSSRPDLGKANNLQEQMSHPPFPPGDVGVSPPPGSAPPQTPGTSGWSLAPSWGHNQRAKARCRDLAISLQE